VESDAWKAYEEEGKLDRVVTLPIASLWHGYRGIGEVPSDIRMGAALFDSADFPSQPQFLPTPVDTLFQQNNIGPLMPQGTTNAATIRYPKEVIVATGAAAVAEGIAKPEAEINFTPVDEPVRKIAVTLPLTDEALDDSQFLRAYINARLRLFVQNEEDRQLLVGSGVGVNLIGLLNRSGINVATTYSIAGANPDQALIDAIFKASMRVEDSFLRADAVAMKGTTWEIARLAKDGNRNYLLGPPADEASLRLWGLRVVLNANMPAQLATNKVALVGAFGSAAMVIRRSGIELAMSDSHGTFFTENKVMLRAEERLALAVFRPQGFAAVTSAA
jgi:HK97 family phage major capsid protein